MSFHNPKHKVRMGYSPCEAASCDSKSTWHPIWFAQIATSVVKPSLFSYYIPIVCC